MGKTLDLGDTVLMGTATRFTRPLTRVRGQDFQRAGGSPRGRERLHMGYPNGRWVPLGAAPPRENVGDGTACLKGIGIIVVRRVRIVYCG